MTLPNATESRSADPGWIARAAGFIWGALREALPLALLAVALVIFGALLGQWNYALAVVAGSVAALLLALLPQVFPYWRLYAYPPRFVLFVLVAATMALFLTEQGRDLGTGLLDAEPHQLALFALALFYWATANWHGTRAAFDRDRDEYRQQWDSYLEHRYPDGVIPHLWKPEWLIRWCARLLGVAVFLVATVVVGLAGQRGGQSMLVYLPALVLAVAAAVLMIWDWSRTQAQEQVLYPGDPPPRPVRILPWFLAICMILAIPALRIAFPTSPIWPYVVAPIAAAAFLTLAISGALEALYEYHPAPVWNVGRLAKLAFWREKPKVIFALCLLAVGFAVAAASFIDPVWVGEAGAVVVAFFAMGAYMTLLEVVWLLGGERKRGTLLFIFLLAFFVGGSRDYHTIRTCDEPGEPCHAAQRQRTEAFKEESDGARPKDPRISLAAAATAWRKQAAPDGAGDEVRVPMIVVATAGGGLRAAYWTALMLERIEKDLGMETFREHLFAISGVSGGSLGAAFYASAASGKSGSGLGASKRLERDFLSPAVAAMAFADGPSLVLPDIGRFDRGYALERSWEEASRGGEGLDLSSGFLNLFPLPSEQEVSWRPALLLNATHQQTGRRLIASHFRSEPRVFLDSWDLWDLLGTDVPASAAVHNSARFTYVSPAGRLVASDSDASAPRRRFGFVLDGGYFENYGAVTALQLIRYVERTSIAVRPVIVLISSDPALQEHEHSRIVDHKKFCAGEGDPTPLPTEEDAPNAFLNELSAPAAGILASREAHGALAAKELAWYVCIRNDPRLAKETAGGEPAASDAANGEAEAAAPAVFVHFVMCERDDMTSPPLGWVLSSAARKAIVEMIDDPKEDRCGNRAELEKLRMVFAH